MQPYIPIGAAFIGAILGGVFAYIISLIQEKRRLIEESSRIKVAILVEVNAIVDVLRAIILQSGMQSLQEFSSEAKIRSMCSVYFGNTSRIGVLKGHEIKAIVAFYSNILSLEVIELTGGRCYYELDHLELSCRLGGDVLNLLK